MNRDFKLRNKNLDDILNIDKINEFKKSNLIKLFNLIEIDTEEDYKIDENYIIILIAVYYYYQLNIDITLTKKYINIFESNMKHILDLFKELVETKKHNYKLITIDEMYKNKYFKYKKKYLTFKK
jgi:hypothetical protein